MVWSWSGQYLNTWKIWNAFLGSEQVSKYTNEYVRDYLLPVCEIIFGKWSNFHQDKLSIHTTSRKTKIWFSANQIEDVKWTSWTSKSHYEHVGSFRRIECYSGKLHEIINSMKETIVNGFREIRIELKNLNRNTCKSCPGKWKLRCVWKSIFNRRIK